MGEPKIGLEQLFQQNTVISSINAAPNQNQNSSNLRNTYIKKINNNEILRNKKETNNRKHARTTSL